MVQGVSGSEILGYSSGTSSGGQSGSIVGKDEFLKLLTYQLRNQNPLKPYDNQEFAAQLAQFSQLEQLTDIRSLLEEQVQTNTMLTQTISNTALPGLLGKSAKALTSEVAFNGSDAANVGYTLTSNASAGKLVITDENGKTVRTMTLESLDLLSGDHKLEWDGKDDNGNAMPASKYNFALDVKDKTGAQAEVETFTYGKIEAVRFKSDGTKLVIGGLEIPLENVLDVSTTG
jgi:flagellar basal-body rod modification protein FlgD